MVTKSDLAFEFTKFKKNGKGLKKSKIDLNYQIKKCEVQIKTEKIASALQKEIGNYVSLICDEEIFLNNKMQNYVSVELKKCILKFFGINNVKNVNSAMVVGLGNSHFVADSLGASVTNKILVTRHAIKQNFNLDEKLIEVSAFNTGVFGKTGIESADIVKNLVNLVKPKVVLIVDTLVANNYKSLGKSFQISDSGICPGGGLNNFRKKINSSFLGVPTFVLGIPLVVYASTFCLDNNKNVNNINKDFETLVVTPKDIENVVKITSKILANAINLALHKGLKFSELKMYF